MSNELTSLLHSAANRLPVWTRPAAAVRADAERARRGRLAGGGALLCAVAVVAVLVSSRWVLPQAAPVVPAELPMTTSAAPAPTPAPAPAQPADPSVTPRHYQLAVARKGEVLVVLESTGWADRPLHTLAVALEAAIPGQRVNCDPECAAPITTEPITTEPIPAETGLQLAADPLLTDAAWIRIAGSDRLVRTTVDPVPLIPCSAQPALAGQSVVASASYAVPSSATPRANEYVLRFADADAASKQLSDLRANVVTCFTGTDWQPEAVEGLDPNGVESVTGDVLAMWDLHEAFYADRARPG